jgi:hypothetical protein
MIHTADSDPILQFFRDLYQHASGNCGPPELVPLQRCPLVSNCERHAQIVVGVDPSDNTKIPLHTDNKIRLDIRADRGRFLLCGRRFQNT